jgi:hypothetical protein
MTVHLPGLGTVSQGKWTIFWEGWTTDTPSIQKRAEVGRHQASSLLCSNNFRNSRSNHKIGIISLFQREIYTRFLFFSPLLTGTNLWIIWGKYDVICLRPLYLLLFKRSAGELPFILIIAADLCKTSNTTSSDRSIRRKILKIVHCWKSVVLKKGQ